jgi:hypothetical protein
MSDMRPFTLWEDESHPSIVARIAIVGDFIPAGSITLPAGGWREAAQSLKQYLSDVHCSFANLEAAVNTHDLPARAVTGLGQSVSASSACLDYLRSIRCGPVGIANNHIYDFGAAGVERTRSAIVNSGLLPLGAGSSLRSEPEVFVWNGPNNVRVGFWTAARASHDLSTPKRPGVEPATAARAAEALKLIRSHDTHCAIALIHAGCLRTNRPDPQDLLLVDAIASVGFTIVAASHSHRIGGAKILHTRTSSRSFCFYGLGSLVSGYANCPLEREGLVVVACLDCRGEVVGLELRPLWLAESGCGTIPAPELGETIIDRFRALSSEIANGSFAQLFYKDQSRGLLKLYLRDARAAFRNAGFRGLASKASRIRVRHVRRLVHKVLA